MRETKRKEDAMKGDHMNFHVGNEVKIHKEKTEKSKRTFRH